MIQFKGYLVLLTVLLSVIAIQCQDSKGASNTSISNGSSDQHLHTPTHSPFEVQAACAKAAQSAIGIELASSICHRVVSIAFDMNPEEPASILQSLLNTAKAFIGGGQKAPLISSTPDPHTLAADIDSLVAKGFKVDMRFFAEDNKITLLMLAAAEGDVDALQKLLDASADINTVDSYGDPALIYAAHSGKAETLQKLIDSGANVDAHGDHGRTACMYAARGAHVQCVKVLIAAGAAMDAVDVENNTCLMEAAASGKTWIYFHFYKGQFGI